SALLLPILAGLYLSGEVPTEFYVSPTWSVLYTSCRDVASLLSLPVSMVSFTLLYFDSRVRKEAYDLELLAREVGPDFHWQPNVQTAAFGYPMQGAPTSQRTYVQTSPLGLAGWRPTPAVHPMGSPGVDPAPDSQTQPSSTPASAPSQEEIPTLGDAAIDASAI